MGLGGMSEMNGGISGINGTDWDEFDCVGTSGMNGNEWNE